MKYEVYHKDSGASICYANSVLEALAQIKISEELDKLDGTYEENAYDWRIDLGE